MRIHGNTTASTVNTKSLSYPGMISLPVPKRPRKLSGGLVIGIYRLSTNAPTTAAPPLSRAGGNHGRSAINDQSK